jgi:hypothetical protein
MINGHLQYALAVLLKNTETEANKNVHDILSK